MGTDDIQRIYDKLDHISQQVTDLTNTSSRCDKAIHGNGLPGLLTRTTILEQALITLTAAHKDCPAREAVSGSSKRQTLSNTIAIGSLVVAVVAIWMAMR